MTPQFMPDSHMPVKHLIGDYAYSIVEGSTALSEAAGMKNLSRIRKAKGLNQSQLAEMAGCNQGTISKIEKGKANATLRLAEKIADVLEVEPVELFGLAELQQRYMMAFNNASPIKQRAVLALLEEDDASPLGS